MANLTVNSVISSEGVIQPDNSLGEQNVTYNEVDRILRWSSGPLAGVATALYTYSVRVYLVLGDATVLHLTIPGDRPNQTAREADLSALPVDCRRLVRIEIDRFENGEHKFTSIIIEKTIICDEIFNSFRIVINTQRNVFDWLIKIQVKAFSRITKIIKRILGSNR